MLFELILAANYMDIKMLLDLSCAKVASMIKGKSPEEIRKTFNIKNDFTPEEEAAIREENKCVLPLTDLISLPIARSRTGCFCLFLLPLLLFSGHALAQHPPRRPLSPQVVHG